MHLPYHERRYSAARTATALRDVKCEKCGCNYCYSLTRTGHGLGSSPYMMDNDGAEARARSSANWKLHRYLLFDAPPVPCPDCGWLQHDMVEELRRGYFPELKTVGFCFAAFFGLCFLVFFLINSDDLAHADFRMPAGLLILAVVGGGFPLLARMVLMRLYNPNRRYPERPKHFAAAPEAIKKAADEEEILDAIPDDPAPPARP